MDENKKTKLFIYADGPGVPTGFGTVVTNIVKNLLNTGRYEIHCLSINWWGDPIYTQKWDNLYMYPMQQDAFGRNRILPLLLQVQPDVLFTVNDYDAVGHIPEALMAYKEKTKKKVPWCLHFPIDGEPIYPEWTEFLKRFVDKGVVIAKYGQEVINKTDKSLNVDQIYHGVDLNTFKVLGDEKRAQLKEGIKNKFCVLMVGTNQLRKQYPIALESFRNFAADKEDVLLLLHTQRNLAPGWNLDKLIRLFGLTEKVAFIEGLTGLNGVSVSELNSIYNLADVFLHPACGEGFGLPLIEAMATGLPIIYHNVTTMPEIVGDAGHSVSTDHFTIFPNRDRELVRPIPSSKQITEALNKLYYDQTYRKELSEKSLQRAKELYESGDCNWEVISQKFDKIFTDMLSDSSEELDIEEIL